VVHCFLYTVYLITCIYTCICNVYLYTYLYMSTERVVAEVIAQIVVVTRVFHFTVNSDVSTQQSNLGPHVNSVLRQHAEMTVANRIYVRHYIIWVNSQSYSRTQWNEEKQCFAARNKAQSCNNHVVRKFSVWWLSSQWICGIGWIQYKLESTHRVQISAKAVRYPKACPSKTCHKN